MRKILSFLLVLVFSLGIAMTVEAEVLTFDELPSGDSFGYIPDGYGNFDWSSDFSWYDGTKYHQYGYWLNNTVSQPAIAWNSAGRDVSLSRDEQFTFNGAYFGAGWDPTLNIVIKGYWGSDLLYSTTVAANGQSPVWAQLDWTGIDTLTFS